MEPLNPVREGYVTRINEAPETKSCKPFLVPDPDDFGDIPVSPPAEVLDALDRAARVMAELGRKNVTIALETSAARPLRVQLHHPGTASADISPRALLNLLDGDTGRLLPGGRRV
jgi:hypothetical protein